MPIARFRLNPTTTEEVAPPPARAPPAAPSPPAKPDPARASAPSPAAGLAALSKLPQRRLLVVGGALLVAFLLVGGSYYALSAEARYPEGYLLEDDEMPSGLRNSDLPPVALGVLGVKETPGEMSESALGNFETDSGVRPEEGWLQAFGASRSDLQAILFAFRFESRGDADEWIGEAREECDSGDGLLLRAGTVVVLVVPESDDNADAMRRVANAVEDKAPKLEFVC